MGCTATLRARASRGHGRTTRRALSLFTLSLPPRRAALDVSCARCRCLSCSLQRTSARPPRRASTRALRRTSATRGAQSDALWVAWCLRGSPAGTHALGAPSARSLHAFGPPSVRSRLCRTPSAWSQSRRPHRNQHRKSASSNPAPRKQAAAVRLCRETSRSSTRKNSAAAVVASNSPGCRATALGILAVERILSTNCELVRARRSMPVGGHVPFCA